MVEEEAEVVGDRGPATEDVLEGRHRGPLGVVTLRGLRELAGVADEDQVPGGRRGHRQDVGE